MIYLRKEVIDALYEVGIKGSEQKDFVNDAVLEKIKKDKKK